MEASFETEARFKRIEAFLESSAADIAAVSAKQRNHDQAIAEVFKITEAISQGEKTLLTAQILMSGAQQKMVDSQQKMADQLQKLVEHQQKMADHFQTTMADGQRRFDESLEKLAAAQRRTEESMNVLNVKSAETQGKLDALIHMWDDWIRDNGGRNGSPKPS